MTFVLSIEVAGTTDVLMIEEAHAGSRVLRLLRLQRRCLVEIVDDDRGDASIIESADFERTRRYAFGARDVEAAKEPENAKACAEPLLGVRPVGENGDDQSLRVGADL